ncbi:MAG: hypothetical protein E7123_02900 [Bacteroidales bacterium]|nr:hypothetical protein [Bacteroidales bacterium]
MPTHGFYNGWNPAGKKIRAGGTLDMQYAFSKKAQGVYQGIGAGIHTFFSKDLLGTPATIYLFQGAPLVLLSDHLALGYEWNLGISSGWKDNGTVTVSPMNVYINVAALFTWKVNGFWKIVFGPEYTHFSNGDTKFPNGGANTVNFRIGAKRSLAASQTVPVENIFARMETKLSVPQSMSYDLVCFGGWRADRVVKENHLIVFNKAFPFAGLNFNPLYHFNSHLSAGASLDLLYDRSANIIVNENPDGTSSFSYPSLLQQTSAGISARAELSMPVFAVNIGIGYSFQLDDCTRNMSSELNAFYGIFSLKAFVSDRLFLNVSYRLNSVLYSHNLMFGIGWRFGSILHP